MHVNMTQWEAAKLQRHEGYRYNTASRSNIYSLASCQESCLDGHPRARISIVVNMKRAMAVAEAVAGWLAAVVAACLPAVLVAMTAALAAHEVEF